MSHDPYPSERPGPAPLPPPYPYGPAPTQPSTSAILLVVVSALALSSGYCCYIGIPGLIFGILGLTRRTSDPDGAARMTKIGWIVVAVLIVVTLLAVVGVVAVTTLAES